MLRGLAFSENVDERYRALGWHVQRVADANDLAGLEAAIAQAKKDPRPSLISVRTHIAYPSPNMQDTHDAHGSPLGHDEIKKTKEILGLPAEETFYVPPELSSLTESVIERGEKAENAWNECFQSYQKAYPELAEEWDRFYNGELPAGWDADLPQFEVGSSLATRAASGKVLNALAPKIRNLIGGSADLAPSTKTWLDCSDSQSATNPTGRNLHFGIREHAMAAMVNGMALHGGLIPYGATFFVFSDYMRPSLRLAALMSLPVIHVFTHDSIGLGEDGPTHQPVEHLPALRAVANLTLIRPGDANETRQAWKVALTHKKGPVALVLSRQNLPTLACDSSDDSGVGRGAYVFSDCQGTPDIILISSGGELQYCVEAKQILEKEGISTRVVSMPSWGLFESQTQEYRDKVLPPAARKRLAVEAASPLGWERWVTEDGGILGIDGFGASAPWKTNMEKYGFSAENVAARARKLLS